MATRYQKIDIAWNDLSVTAPSKVPGAGDVQILKSVSGQARAGQVSSIMGPSGAGKTTMMDLLAGRVRHTANMTIEGDVLVNGEPINVARFRKSTGYVTQDDYLMPTETVKECLMFSAQLRMPASVSLEEKRKQVELIIEELGLNDCANTFIGSSTAGIKGVSGGEKRRTSVGVELITSPTCLFLDEPTSGLDSEIAVSIMRTLKNMAAKGRTIVLTIHQPNSDITEQFDHFILMAKGQILYGGPWKHSIAAFAEAGFQCPQFKNPTDYYMAVASDPANLEVLVHAQNTRWASSERSLFAKSKGSGAAAVLAAAGGTSAVKSTKSAKSLTGVEVDGEKELSKRERMEVVADGPATSMLAQMWCLCQRFLRAWKRHPIMLMGEAVQYLFLGFFIGGMYFDVSSSSTKGVFDRAAASFFLLVCIAFTPPFTAVTVWQDERVLVKREVNQNVYSLGVFFWSKSAVLVPVETFFGVVVSLVAYFMFGFQHNFGKFCIFVLCVVLCLFIAESLGMMFAMVTPTADLAIVLASILFILLLALTGFLTSDMPVYYEWIQHINFLRYGNSAMFINEMQGVTLTGPDGEDVSGDSLIDSNTLDNDLSIGANLAVLVGILVVVRVSAYVGLHVAYCKNWL